MGREIPGYQTTITIHSLDDADNAWGFQATIIDDIRARGGEFNVKLCLGVVLEPADASQLLMIAGSRPWAVVKATSPLGVIHGLLDRVDVLGAVGDAKHPSVIGAVIELVGVKFTEAVAIESL